MGFGLVGLAALTGVGACRGRYSHGSVTVHTRRAPAPPASRAAPPSPPPAQCGAERSGKRSARLNDRGSVGAIVV
eukprot:4279379-Prymnesium_polylepis.2